MKRTMIPSIVVELGNVPKGMELALLEWEISGQ